MDDDINTADAIAAIFELVRDANTVASSEAVTAAYAKAALAVLEELCGIIGVGEKAEQSLDSEIESLIEQRQEARRSKNFAEADRIRDMLKEQGIILEDTPQGVKWHKE